MDLAKKLAKVFSLIFLAVFVASCDSGCVESNEFDKSSVTVGSYPLEDGVDGLGDAQVAKWHDTGLKTNGEKIVLQISGAWTPWYGNDDISGLSQLKATPACTFCSINESSSNCICHANQEPKAEEEYLAVHADDCKTNLTAQNDSTKCTCSKQYGTATDYGVYHFPLNIFDKNHDVLNPDFQYPCKYQAGMGLFLGLFGSSGAVVPIRAYHLFSETAVCDVVRNSQGQCLDADGNDVTKYLFTSRDDKILVKDDGEGNLGPNYNLENDTYHNRNEKAKLIILDSRYDDNYGEFQVTFLGGLGDNQDTGLLEYLVRLMEDQVMGVVDANGTRQGGIIQTMFNQIVLDSGFVSVVQMALSFYILFYGVAVLIGVADVSKKELMTRMLKIGLVIFFTSKTSWYWYDKIVVTFFKDGMDSIITMFMNFSDANIDPTSGVVTAQMERASLNSNATRFSYADLIIRNMLSTASAKKIFGLFFGVPLFGLIYIAAIYALIAFFMYVMLNVAMAYVVAIVKLAFVLALGPIFIAFTLSGHTNDMFKKWLSFIGSRSLEIIFMFLVLYNFLVLIDQNFTALLSYKACVTQWNLGFFSIPILKANVNRSLAEWCSSFMMLGGLIFITKLVLDKVPDLASSLITIGGAAGAGSPGGPGSAGSMVGGLMGAAKTIGGAGLSVASKVGAKTYEGVSSAVSRSGAVDAVSNAVGGAIRALPGGNTAMDTMNKAIAAMPSNPRAMYRNSIIDSAISIAQKDGASKGLTGKDLDQHVRSQVTSTMLSGGTKGNTSMGNSPNTAVAIGMNLDTISKRLDEKLINKPLMDFIKSESAALKAGAGLKAGEAPPVGRAMREELNNRINQWAENNLNGGAASIKSIMEDKNAVVNGVRSGGMGLSNMKDFIRSQSEYSAAEAAKAFRNNPAKQQEYLQHLKDNQFKIEDKKQKTADGAMFKSLNKFNNAVSDKFGTVVKAVKPLDNFFGSDALTDTKRAAESFMRKVSNEENKSGSIADTLRSKAGLWLKNDQGKAINQELREGDRKAVSNYLSKNGAAKEQKAIREHYDAKIKETKNGLSPNHFVKTQLEAKKQEKLKESEDRRNFFKKDLEKLATKFAKKDSSKVTEDLRKLKKLEKETWAKFNQQVKNKANASAKKAQDIAKLALSKYMSDKESQIKRSQERLEALRIEKILKPDTKLDVKIQKEEENKARLERERIKVRKDQETLQKEIDVNLAKLGVENKKLEDEKRVLMKEIVGLKTNVKSLENIVKEIKDAERTNLTAQEIMAAKSLGESPSALREAENVRGKELKESLREELEKEYKDTLKEHSKFAQAILTEDELQKIASLKEEEKIDATLKILHEKFPTLKYVSPSKYKTAEELKAAEAKFKKDSKKLEASLASLTEEQRSIIENSGGIEAIKDGLIDIGGTTLLEKYARLQYFEEQFGKDLESQAHTGERDPEEAAPSTGSLSVEEIEISTSESELAPASQTREEVALTTEELTAKVEEIKTEVSEKIKADNVDLEKEYEELEKLKKAPKTENEEDNKGKDGKKDPDKEDPKQDKSALKSILSVQVSILDVQSSAARTKKSAADGRLVKMIADNKAGGPGAPTQDQINEAIKVISDHETEIASLDSKKMSVMSELSEIND